MPKLSILVFVASPLDYARYRHTSLFFEFEPEAQAAANHTQTGADAEYIKSSLMEVIGSPGFMTFFERKNWDTPVASNSKIDTKTFPFQFPKFFFGLYTQGKSH